MLLDDDKQQELDEFLEGARYLVSRYQRAGLEQGRLMGFSIGLPIGILIGMLLGLVIMFIYNLRFC